MNTAADVQKSLRLHTDHAPRVFKAEPGQYAEHDKFLGISVPNIRLVTKQFKDLPLPEVEKLLQSEWHDERLCALLMLVDRYRKADSKVAAKADAAGQKTIYDFYMQHIGRVNNWDLVDSSAEFIVGPYLEHRPEKMSVLTELAASSGLWERRIAMLATFDYIKKGRADEALVICGQLLYDKHDLIQKAVGWMLREIGKRVSRAPLLRFLDKHAATMPRTTLRYAIEHLPPEQRNHYMGLKGVN